MMNDKTILITGGTGSFGNHFIKTVLNNYQPKKLIIYSRDELKQFEMQQRYPCHFRTIVQYIIGHFPDEVKIMNRVQKHR